MMRFTIRMVLVVSLLLLLGSAIAPAWAFQEQGRERAAGEPAELRRAMHEYFEKRLRAELSLTDEQTEHILPTVTRLEEAKTEMRQTRMETARSLRRGMQQGATDDELQELLDRLDRLEGEQRELERSMLEEIDEVLSVRQRVQLRFFIQQFRQEMQRKVQEFRGDRYRNQRRRPPREDP